MISLTGYLLCENKKFSEQFFSIPNGVSFDEIQVSSGQLQRHGVKPCLNTPQSHIEVIEP